MVAKQSYLLAVAVIAIASLPILTAITCYKCDSTGSPQRSCDNFDASSRFHEDCPKSDMCLTKVLEYELLNSTIVRTFIRGCLPQEMIYKQYNIVTGIYEDITTTIKFKEGCERLEIDGELPIEYCRCKGNLCNKTYDVKDRDSYAK